MYVTIYFIEYLFICNIGIQCEFLCTRTFIYQYLFCVCGVWECVCVCVCACVRACVRACKKVNTFIQQGCIKLIKRRDSKNIYNVEF